MTPKARSKRRTATGQTELRRTSREAARRLEREAADWERRGFLTAKFDRTWSALKRLRAHVGPVRFRDLMIDLPDALDETGNPDLGGISDFHDLLGGDRFREFLAKVTEALEIQSDTSALWTRWIDIIVARTLPQDTQ